MVGAVEVLALVGALEVPAGVERRAAAVEGLPAAVTGQPTVAPRLPQWPQFSFRPRRTARHVVPLPVGHLRAVRRAVLVRPKHAASAALSAAGGGGSMSSSPSTKGPTKGPYWPW